MRAHIKNKKSPANGAGLFSFGQERLLLLAGRLLGARLAVALVLLRGRLRIRGLCSGIGRRGLLGLVAHFIDPF
jgi:hypothetical protein